MPSDPDYYYQTREEGEPGPSGEAVLKSGTKTRYKIKRPLQHPIEGKGDIGDQAVDYVNKTHEDFDAWTSSQAVTMLKHKAASRQFDTGAQPEWAQKYKSFELTPMSDNDLIKHFDK
jgi:hypothetical protein